MQEVVGGGDSFGWVSSVGWLLCDVVLCCVSCKDVIAVGDIECKHCLSWALKVGCSGNEGGGGHFSHGEVVCCHSDFILR